MRKAPYRSGPIDHCPVTLRYIGKITATGWSPTANRQVQYKWIRSDGADTPTETVHFPATGPAWQSITTTSQIGTNGTFWVAIQVIHPTLTNNQTIHNNTSNHTTVKLTCPTPGNLQKL